MRKGFTLIELLVIATMIGLILTIGLAGYNRFNRQRIVRETALNLLNNLRYAQEKALSGEKPTEDCTVLNGYQVSFFSGKYEIQAKCSPEGLAGKKKEFPLESVDFVSLPDNLVFKVLAHGVEGVNPLSGKTEINLEGFDWTYKIKVTKTGEISDEGFQ